MDVSLFDFELPEDRIALRPAVPRDAARLLVVGADGKLTHAHMRDLPQFLNAGDAMVLNDSKVFHARLMGQRPPRGEGNPPAGIELMLHKRIGEDRFLAFALPAKRLRAGDALHFGSLAAKVEGRGERGEVEIRFAQSGAELDKALEAEGQMPLPPYIARKRGVDARDDSDYQTVYARQTGSVAAPTAGLHFTPELLAALDRRGVAREQVTLHVGAGTFLPVQVDDTKDHRMHSEFAILDGNAAARLNAVHQRGGRVMAVGTTSLRTLESAAAEAGELNAFSRETDIFITPGYRFRAVDMLLTNFHLPRSTLFMLVSAFSGLDVMRAAYVEAIRENYRFYSYGDGCLLLRPS